MAYRSKSRSRSRGRSTRRTTTRKRTYRGASRSSGARAQVVRIVVEQPTQPTGFIPAGMKMVPDTGTKKGPRF